MPRTVTHSYFVVMVDHGKLGLEAIVQPEITKREVIARIKSSEYQNIAFIHHVHDGVCEDVTAELTGDASYQNAMSAIDEALDAATYRDWRWDQERDNFKNLVVL